MNCGSAPYLYIAEPFGCLQTMGRTYNGNTAFIQLCSLPRALYIQSSDGNTCGGDVDPSTAIAVNNAAPELRIATNAYGIDVSSTRPLPAGIFRLLDMRGRIVVAYHAMAGLCWRLDAPDLPGAYLIAFDADGAQLRQHILWTP